MAIKGIMENMDELIVERFRGFRLLMPSGHSFASARRCLGKSECRSTRAVCFCGSCSGHEPDYQARELFEGVGRSN